MHVILREGDKLVTIFTSSYVKHSTVVARFVGRWHGIIRVEILLGILRSETKALDPVAKAEESLLREWIEKSRSCHR